MAKINRKFFVPYIENLCALYLIRDKLKKRYRVLASQIDEIEGGIKDTSRPEPPRIDKVMDLEVGLSIGWAVFCAFDLILWLIIVSVEDEAPPGVLVFIMFVLALFVVLSIIHVVRSTNATKENNELERRRYQRELEQRDENLAYNDRIRKEKLPALREEFELVKGECRTAKKLMDSMYAANLIPMKYRDFYSTVYLYDWFVNGISDDLDMALNTFVLERIVEKLDRIIQNQSEIIINQCIDRALRESEHQERMDSNRRLEDKMDNLISLESENRDDIAEIRANSEATAYFVAADYWKNL